MNTFIKGLIPVVAAIAQELEARCLRAPVGCDRWDAKQVSRLLVA